MNIFHSILYILLIQICKCYFLKSSWGTRAYYSETFCDFFLGSFFSIRPTDPISGNAFDGKRRKKGEWPKKKKINNEETPKGLTLKGCIWLPYCFFFFSFRGERSCSSSSNPKSQMICHPNLKQWK